MITDRVIIEQRDYHVHTGKLPEVLRLYEEEGIPIQQEILGGLVGAFTTEIGALSTYSTLWRYDSFAEREERRARLQADPRWKEFLAKVQPLMHTQQNRILVPTSFSPLRVSALDGKVAIVTGGAQGIGAAIAAGLDGRGRDGRRRRLNPPEGGIRADVSSEDGRGPDGRGDARAPRSHRHPRQQRRSLRLARDARVHGDPARGVESRDGGERRLDVPHLPRRRPRDARAGRREDREHLVGHAVSRRPVPPALRDVEGRDRRASRGRSRRSSAGTRST